MANADPNAGVFNLTDPATLTFENLFTARAFKGPNGKENGEPKYDAALQIEPNHVDIPAIKAKLAEVARARWPGRNLGELAFPLSDGSKLADKAKAKGKEREFSRGKVVITARSQFAPALSVVENGTLVDYEGDRRPLAKPFFYNGVAVLAQFNFVAYVGVGANPDGVTAYLNMVCSLRRGDRIGGGARPAAEVFKGYAGKFTAEDPTAGLGGSSLADEIAF